MTQSAAQSTFDLIKEQTTSRSTYNYDLGMENMQELIPFAKEMLSQKPGRGLLKIYLVGSVFAVLGTVIGLVETVCQPFSSGDSMDAEMLFLLAQKQRTVETETWSRVDVQEDEEEKDMARENGALIQSTTIFKQQRLSQRVTANRLHAS